MNGIRLSMAALGCCLIATRGFAAELGRTTRIPTQHAAEVMGESQVGIEADAVWDVAHWDAGSGQNASGPGVQAAVYYGLGSVLDLRVSAKLLSLDSDDDQLAVFRVGGGVRAWIPGGAGFVPYAGALLSYCAVNSDTLSGLDPALSLAGEAGVAYSLTDAFLLRLGLQAETLLTRPEGSAGGATESFSFSTFGLGIGVTIVL